MLSISISPFPTDRNSNHLQLQISLPSHVCLLSQFLTISAPFVRQFVHHHHHHHHHYISVMVLGQLLTHSGLTYPDVSSKVYHDSFFQSDSSVSLPWVIYFEAFYLHVISSFPCIPVNCPKLVLFLAPLQFVHLFCNLSKCVLLFFSCISSLLLLLVLNLQNRQFMNYLRTY